MHIQDKVTWGADVDEKLGLVSTLGLDCVALDLPDSRRGNPVMDFSTREIGRAHV